MFDGSPTLDHMNWKEMFTHLNHNYLEMLLCSSDAIKFSIVCSVVPLPLFYNIIYAAGGTY